MSSIPPPMGLPFGIPDDVLTFVGILTAFVMLGALAFLLWAARPPVRMTYRVRCPVHRTEATIQVRAPRGDERAEVERCSLCEPPTRVACEGRCLRLVA